MKLRVAFRLPPADELPWLLLKLLPVEPGL
jgi:hypothetical protein